VCPANVTAFSLDGNAAPVTYDPPSVIAGEPPLRIACTPASGTPFVLGNTTVTCRVTDAFLREATPCTFIVTLAVPPKISVTSFMAFGNSITEGKNGDDPAGHILVNNYPEDLRAMLAARYTSQSISMATRGLGGEWAVDGVNRLPNDLASTHPQALLLEEGINDLLGGNPATLAPMIDALKSMVRQANHQGISVFLVTLTPMRPGGLHGDGALPLIPEANTQIRGVAQSEHVTLVDLYAGIGGSPDPYIGADGLHPTEMGYQKIAQIFFDAIRANLEQPHSATRPIDLVRAESGARFH
jgi:lysophospholipase L1-like esterase